MLNMAKSEYNHLVKVLTLCLLLLSLYFGIVQYALFVKMPEMNCRNITNCPMGTYCSNSGESNSCMPYLAEAFN